MTKYLDLPLNKKLNLLRLHTVGCEWPDLEQEQWCLHCNSKFSGHAARVWQSQDGALWLECGTPGCDGSPIDWAPYPWWDPKHPETRAFLKASKSRSRQRRSRSSSGAAGDDVPF